MFGPNVSTRIDVTVDYHHREARFAAIHREILALFREKFAIPSSSEIVIYTGSGTLAVEAFIASYRGSLRVDTSDIENDKFAKRWKTLLEYYGKHDPSSDRSIKVLFETSQSQYNGDQNATFVDAVSGFPFWPAPRSPVWSTVSSKLLGAAPVLSLLVVDKDFLRDNLEDTPSYLSPFKYVEYQKIGETPFTPALPLFQDFRDKLQAFDVVALREKIAHHHALLMNVIGAENVVSPDLSPTLTINPGVIPEEVVARWNLYGQKGGGRVQIFLYSETSDKYEMLAKDIERTRGQVCQRKPQTQAEQRRVLSPSTST